MTFSSLDSILFRLLLLTLLFSFSSCANESINASNAVPDRYCSFFNNRAPQPVTNLKNCTWYRNSSCCLQREIDATFGQVKPLRGASPRCQLWLNYLICYICSPDQNHFYRRERLTVCEEVCDGFLQACGDAMADGKRISETYNTGMARTISMGVERWMGDLSQAVERLGWRKDRWWYRDGCGESNGRR